MVMEYKAGILRYELKKRTVIKLTFTPLNPMKWSELNLSRKTKTVIELENAILYVTS